MTVGEKIRIERARLRISQSELAEKAGINRSVLSQIETELVIPNEALEKQIMDCFDTLSQERTNGQAVV